MSAWDEFAVLMEEAKRWATTLSRAPEEVPFCLEDLIEAWPKVVAERNEEEEDRRFDAWERDTRDG